MHQVYSLMHPHSHAHALAQPKGRPRSCGDLNWFQMAIVTAGGGEAGGIGLASVHLHEAMGRYRWKLVRAGKIFYCLDACDV